MREYQLEYSAQNHYKNEVWGVYLKFLIHPFSALGIQVYPPVFTTNVEGNWWLSNARSKSISEIYFKSNEKFNDLNISYQVKVITPEINPFNREWLSSHQESTILNSSNWIIDNYTYLYSNPLKTKSYLSSNQGFNWLNSGNLLDKILDLRNQVYHTIEFIPGVTDTTTNAKEVLKIKKGVCQDFAHVFLALLRNFGVPSRYTSGYLHEENGIRGASQLHAWVECHVPNVGWIGIDPTNKLLIDNNYIKICHGYDYDDCLPVSGVVNSSINQQSTKYQVNVQQIQ